MLRFGSLYIFGRLGYIFGRLETKPLNSALSVGAVLRCAVFLSGGSAIPKKYAFAYAHLKSWVNVRGGVGVQGALDLEP